MHSTFYFCKAISLALAKGVPFLLVFLLTKKVSSSFSLFDVVAVIIVLVVGFLVYREYSRSKKRKEADPYGSSKHPKVNSKKPAPELNPEVEAEILSMLEQFEQNKGYLDKDMTLARMADLLHTNTRYASIIITKYRHKGTIEYLNDIRITYAIQLLTSESKYRHYSQKALSKEVGFGSSKSFTKAFREKTEMSLVEFVAALDS